MTFDLDDYRRVRRALSTDDWLDLMVRSLGYEPAEKTRGLKLLLLVRLIPLAERNYNLVGLGPRGTGKLKLAGGVPSWRCKPVVAGLQTNG